MANILIERLSSSCKKQAFSCGISSLDHYLHRQAKQDVKKNLSTCFVLVNENKDVLGYYTLSNASMVNSLLPEDIKRKSPYPETPATLLGRLAVAANAQGNGYGELLLLDAFKKSYLASEITASMAVVVDPLDNNAANFYTRYGFIHLKDTERMFLPMKTIKTLLKTAKMI